VTFYESVKIAHSKSDHERSVRPFHLDLLGGIHLPPLEIMADPGINLNGHFQVLTRISAIHGLPEQIVVDNGPEFISNAVDAWSYIEGFGFFYPTKSR